MFRCPNCGGANLAPLCVVCAVRHPLEAIPPGRAIKGRRSLESATTADVVMSRIAPGERLACDEIHRRAGATGDRIDKALRKLVASGRLVRERVCCSSRSKRGRWFYSLPKGQRDAVSAAAGKPDPRPGNAGLARAVDDP